MGAARSPVRRRTLAVIAAAMTATAWSGGTASAAAPSPAPPAPLLGTGQSTAIAGHYIVVYRAQATAAERGAVRAAAVRHGAGISHVFGHAVSGFAAALPASALDAVRHDPDVAYVEADQRVRAVDTQSPATWGLDRIDQRALPLSNSYTYNTTGAGVKAYIIDTGINVNHTDFGGRAVNGYDAVDGSLPAADCNGHGTHVSGTVGGATYGVAKGVTLVAVRVLDCNGSGTNSQVIAGIDWVTGNHAAGQPAVANMSLGGGASSALDTAVSNSINDGVTYAIAAGNGNALGQAVDACTTSPARVAAAITVSATDSSDTKPAWANTGTCVDIFAPGVSITSDWYSSNTATNTISGTSMATPHVAGAAALYLQSNPSATPQAVRDQLVNTSTQGVVVNAGSGSPNRLLYTLGGSSPPPPPPPPSGCTGLNQTFTGTLSGSGDYDIQPNGTYYYSAVSGVHHGCLDGPSGVDFDLYLYKWNGFSWSRVASGTSTAPDEDVSYSGTAGYYYWRIVSYSGSGSYTFGLSHP